MKQTFWMLGMGLFLVAGCSREPEESPPPPVVVERIGLEELDQAIALGGRYLVQACDSEGRFQYRIHLDGASQAPRYNMLRHAGAMYALGMLYDDQPDAEIGAALRRSAGYLLRMVGPVEGEPGLLALWSYPEVTGSGSPTQAKLGGAGLALVGLLAAERVDPGSVPVETLRGLARFILSMQKEDGSFYSKYWESAGRDDSWTSLYYPGEAALGLVLLYRHDPDPDWLQGAADVLGYLSRLRSNQPVVEADHWALLATEQLMPLYDQCDQPVSVSDLQRHAAQVVVSCLASPWQGEVGSPLTGCLVPDGRTTPTGTRLEGTMAALAFLPDDQEPVRRRIRRVAHGAIAFLSRAQVKTGPYAGAVPRAIQMVPEVDEDSHRFNRRAREVRIDYVQHALSAMIQYRALLGESP